MKLSRYRRMEDRLHEQIERRDKGISNLGLELNKAKELIGRMKEHLQKSCPPSLSCNQCLLKDCKRKNLIAEAEEVMK